MLCYCVFKHDGIWDKYEAFCKAPTLPQKQAIYLEIREIFVQKDWRIKNQDKEWANFTPKYPMNCIKLCKSRENDFPYY